MNPQAVASRDPEHRVEMTRKRLWFLYQLAGLIKAEIATLTGWHRGDIDYRLRKWDLQMFTSGSFWRTNRALDRAIARYLGLDEQSLPAIEARIDTRHALQALLRERLLAGAIDWEGIDAFPWPEELT